MGGLSRSRYEPSTSDTWKQWEGRTVAEMFPLQSYLGGTEHSAVFLTLVQAASGDSKEAAIKLISADEVNAEEQLQQWKVAGGLDHANLIRIFTAGRCELDGVPLLYVVMEYAEETLSQILPERALTPDEARSMLPAVLGAMRYVHDKGLVHGRIQPSNILAIGDQVKLSSDSLSAPDEGKPGAGAYRPPEATSGKISTPADVWQLGLTVSEVLTQRLPRFDLHPNKEAALPDGIAEPFREIVENCLRSDPARRWAVAQIAERLDRPQSKAFAERGIPDVSPGALSPTAATKDSKRATDWPYVVALIAAVLIVVFLIARPKPPANTASPAPVENASGPSAAPSDSSATNATPSRAAQPGAGGKPNAAPPVSSAAGQSVSEGRVVERVMPRIAPGALHSITGKIRIQVKVDVDDQGHVTEAHLKSRGPSRYFAERALEAAREWKFEPVRENGRPVASHWIVQFALTRRAIDDSVIRIER